MLRLIFLLPAALACSAALVLIAVGSNDDAGAEPNCAKSSSRKCPTNTPTPSPTPSPSPTPDPRNDALLAADVSVGNHNMAWFGAYEPGLCEDAVIYMGASGLEPELVPTYDFLVAASDDRITPRNGQWSNIGNSSEGGAPGTWKTTRKVSLPSIGTGIYDYGEGDAPYILVGVFSNQAMRYVAEVHCSRDYPQ